MNYYERHIGDYLKDTAHLSLLEHGIYGRLLDIYYSREAAIPGEQVARLVGAKSEDERAALLCVLNEFFVLDESGGWAQRRCDEEISRFKDKQRKAKAAAAASWESRRPERPQSERIANAVPTHSGGNAPSLQTQTPIPKKEKRPARKRATPLPDDFLISARVNNWAIEKGLSGHMDAQYEAFVSYAKRKGATYVDWDEALMTAIREDWAKCRVPRPQDIARTTVPADPSSFNRTREPPMTPEQREAADKARKLAMSAVRLVAR